jgi:flagellar protein FlaG
MLIPQLQGAAPPTKAAPAERTAASAQVAVSAAPGTRSLVESRTPPPPAAEEVAQAVTQGNRAMAALSASLSFEVDAATNITVVKVIDTSDNHVLRQIPSQEMLDIARALDKLQGLLLRDKA